MSIKFNEHNHPTLELDGSFHVCLHRAVYDEDLQLRTSASDDLSEETAKALADLRRLVTATPNLNFPLELSTNWMVPVYLRCCENDAKRAFDILDYSYRLLYRENEFTKSYAQIRHVFELGLMRYLPECTDDGAVIAVIQMGRVWDTSKVSLVEFIAAIRLAGIATMLHRDAQQNGVQLILDVDGLSMGQITNFTPRCCSYLFSLMDYCTPVVTKGLHVVNNGMLFNVLFSTLKPFMSRDLRSKTVMHGKNWNSLAKHIKPRFLPPKYGGSSPAPDFDGELFAKLFQHYEGYFNEYDSYGFTGIPDSK